MLSDLAEMTAVWVQWAARAGVVLLCGGIGLCLARIARGPTLADRATAADVVGVQLIGVVILLTLRSGTLLFIDGILVLSLLGFAGTVAVAQFIARPHMPAEEKGGDKDGEEGASNG